MKMKNFIISAIILSLLLAVCACTVPGNTLSRQYNTWKFVVISDTQGSNKEQNNKSCINDEILKLIAADMADENPDFVLVAGDLVNGWFRNSGTDYAVQYSNWKNAMGPVYSKGIRVYAVRGNHDSGPERLVLPPLPEDLEPPPGSLLLLEDEFKNAMIEPYTPLNGPEEEKGLTYSFIHKNAFIIGLDQYTGGQHRVNQLWLDRQLEGNRQYHLFVFGHEPAFEADHKDNLSFYPEERNRFRDSIVNAGGRIYFCGHDHFYNRALVKDGEGNSLWQVIAGTGGARLRTWSGSYKESSSVSCEYHNSDYYGYLIVTVDGSAENVQWKALVDIHAGKWQVYDTFTYTAVY